MILAPNVGLKKESSETITYVSSQWKTKTKDLNSEERGTEED